MAEADLFAARQWLEKAERDLAAAERLMLGDAPLSDIALFHCQQTVEKAFKAFLTSHQTPFEKTHNLVALLDLVVKIAPNLTGWLEAAKSLTPYATEFRYPGDPLQPEAGEAAQALRNAKSILRDIGLRLAR